MAIIDEIIATINDRGLSILDSWIGSVQTKKEILAVLYSSRNLLLEGPSGVGKTLMAKSIAQALPNMKANDCSFNCEPNSTECPECRVKKKKVIIIKSKERFVRVQGSPEIAAEDLIGDIDPILAMKYGAFDPMAFYPGKIVKANRKILFIDEINRLPEKMQNTLLQVLQEREMTIGNFDLNFPIDTILIATMNNRDIMGIERLSEALKDRLERVVVPYPTESEEILILEKYGKNITNMSEEMKKKIVQTCQRTRNDEELEFPASPRSAIAIYELSQSFAKLRKSENVTIEDLSSAIRLALLGRLSPTNDSDYFNKMEDYIESLKKDLCVD